MQRGPQDWDAGPSLLDSLWRHKWLVALAVLLGMVAAYGWSSRQPVRYEATMQLFQAGGQGAQGSGDQDPDRVLRNQVELLSSPAVLNQVAVLSRRPLTLGQVKDRVSIEAAGDADVITVRALDATPEAAARLAELVPRAYQRTLEQQARLRVAQLQQDQDRLKAELAKIQAALQASPGDASLVADRDAATSELRQTAEAKRQALELAAAPAPLSAPGRRAVVGDEPAEPQPARAAAVGALLGLAVSVALVSLRTGQQLRAAGAARAAEAEAAGQPGRDLAVMAAEADGSSDGQAGEVRLLDSVTRQLQRPDAPWRLRRPARDRRAEPTEVQRPAAGINDFTQLTASIQRIFRSLEGQRYRLYEQNVPQMAADDIANWFPVDLAVVLLENDQGKLQVAGSVGLSNFEQHMTIEDNRELLLQVVEMGSRMVDEEERSRLAAANVPGSQAQTLIVVPLIYDQVAFGMLLMGQRGDSGDQPALVQADVDRVRIWARDISPYLRAWLLLRYLKLRLRMVQ